MITCVLKREKGSLTSWISIGCYPNVHDVSSAIGLANQATVIGGEDVNGHYHGTITITTFQ